MIESILILVFGLLPAGLSLWMVRRAKTSWEDQLHEARSHYYYYRQSRSRQNTADEPDPIVATRFIGNINCRYNARSPYLRCALHPDGDCETCIDFEPR